METSSLRDTNMMCDHMEDLTFDFSYLDNLHDASWTVEDYIAKARHIRDLRLMLHKLLSAPPSMVKKFHEQICKKRHTYICEVHSKRQKR